MSVNKCTFIGNMGNRAEIKATENGVKVAQFSIACTDRGYTRKDGIVIPDKTEWIPIVAWRGLAEIVEKYTKKGSKVYIEGRFTSRQYDNRDGQKRIATEIVAEFIELLDARRDEKPLPADPLSPPTDKIDFNRK